MTDEIQCSLKSKAETKEVGTEARWKSDLDNFIERAWIAQLLIYLLYVIRVLIGGLLQFRKDRRPHISTIGEENAEGIWNEQSLALLTAVMGIFAGAVYLALFIFHDAFPILAVFKSVNLSTWELLTFSRVESGNFLVITTVTTTFILSMGVNTVAVCFIIRKFAWGTFFTILSLFTIATFSLSFFTMLRKFVPYSITIAGGNLKVPAIFIVIFYDIYVIILVHALTCTAQCLQSSWHKQDADVERKILV